MNFKFNDKVIVKSGNYLDFFKGQIGCIASRLDTHGKQAVHYNVVFQTSNGGITTEVFAAKDLGFYSRAKSCTRLSTENLTGSINRVAFPVFSTIQDDNSRLKRGVRRALTTMVFLNFPMMIGLW